MTSNELGRPTKYTPEFGEKICDILATTDTTMDDVCALPGMPDRATIFRWLRLHPDFYNLYTCAREMQTEVGYDEIKDIVDAPLPLSPVYDVLGNYVGDKVDAGIAMAEIQLRKLKIDVIKFKLVKLQPKRFGDNRSVNVDVKIRQNLSDTQFERLLAIAAAPVQAQIEESGYEEAQEVTEINDFDGIEDDDDLG